MVTLVNSFVVSVLLWIASSQTCYQPQTFTITCEDANCSTGYLINGALNRQINMTRDNNCVYTFNINTPGRAFRIYRASGTFPRSEVTSFQNGVIANGVGSQTYQPNSHNTNNGNGLAIGSDYPYSFCGNTNDPGACPGGIVRVFSAPVSGQWSAWSSCTKSCGGGVYQRNCNSPLPANGGDTCPGSALGDVPCHTVPCGCRIDLMYVLDGSGSIHALSWDYLKTFAIQLSRQVDIGNGSLGGIVQFSTSTRFELPRLTPPQPPMINNLDLVIEAIENMQQINSRTAIGDGLDLGQRGLIQSGRWSRDPPVPKVILLITDGSSNEGSEPTGVSRRLRQNGTEIFVIGVGGDFDLQQLLALPSDPRETHYFNITGYDALNQITNDVAYALCYSRGGSAPATLYLLLLLLLPLAAGLGLFVFIWRRRKPKKVVPPPEPEPVPVPVKAAAPAPVVDKPKDWTVPGTRYIGFGQANIKVKWGADAPPSAPRGHDKYDRWSMQHGGGPLPPTSPTSQSPMLAPEIEAPSESGASGGARQQSCCAKFCPCFFMGGAGAAANRSQMAKNAAADEEGQWQENAAVGAASTNSVEPMTPSQKSTS